MDLQKKIDVELDSAIEALSHYEVGSDDYGRAVNNVERLYRMRMDEQKNNADYWLKHDNDAINRRDLRIDKCIGYALDGAKFAGYVILFIGGLKFEETGSVMSMFVRNHANKLKP